MMEMENLNYVPCFVVLSSGHVLIGQETENYSFIRTLSVVQLRKVLAVKFSDELKIRELEKKLSDLKQEKHDLFTQLKKVLNQEEEHRRRLMQSQQQHYREFNEVLAKVRPTTGMLPLPLSMNDAQFGVIPHTGCYPATLSIPTSPLKRSRSPSSPFNVGLQPFISLQDPKYGDNILRLAAPPVAYEPRSYALNSASDVSMLPTYNDGDGGDPHLKYGPPYVRANVRTASLQLSGMKPSILPNRTGPQNF
ncbi:unnamed protein product [Soboliphyme baturini]|uniref:DP domain-containing protein n=1 Tax=Soboliphyme baturini TaxID=241478 RepID=A0A183IP69_9BILA|nr:unnamed protein product [Soboliphyme baturini]